MKVKDKEKLNNPLKGWQILSAISSMVFDTVQWCIRVVTGVFKCFYMVVTGLLQWCNRVGKGCKGVVQVHRGVAGVGQGC